MDWTKVDAVADELSATRAEVLGLVLLVLGGVVVSWLVVQGGGSPSAASGPVTVASPSSTAADAAAVGEADAAVSAGNAAEGATGAHATADGATEAPPALVVVHVTGAVVTPGVVELGGGARVVDAVTAAGGPTGDAALDALNMARPVADGERVHVPTPQEVADGLVPESGGADAGPDTGGTGAGGAAGAAPSARDAEGRLDLNLATPSELEELPGVGPVLAQRIAAWRDANGGFEAVGQLREVTGIGEQTFQGLADLVVVG